MLDLSTLPNTGHFVYHLVARAPGYEPEDRVQHVYVGVSSHLRSRLVAHSRKWWWSALDLSLCALSEHDTRAEALDVEADMIRWYQPAMNRAGRLLVVS